jgi:hypothetical protein
MARHLLTTLSLSLFNPSKKELNAMADLLAKSTPIVKPGILYTVYGEARPIRSNLIQGRAPNIRVLNYLASCDYNEIDLRVTEIIKPLQ